MGVNRWDVINPVIQGQRPLDRTEYFELKVQGLSDALISRLYECRQEKLSVLKTMWGFEYVKTDQFVKMMENAKEGQVYQCSGS